jgi:DNA-binding GntR family transcriptional regulator
LLERDIARYRLLIRSCCRIAGTTANLRAALEEHLQILAALEQRDGRAASRAMHLHIEARLAGVQAVMNAASTP